MRAIEKARAAIREIMGPVIVHPEASAEVIARQQARQERAADEFARAAVLAFLEGVEVREIGFAAAAVRDQRDCGKVEAVLAALRAEAGAAAPKLEEQG